MSLKSLTPSPRTPRSQSIGFIQTSSQSINFGNVTSDDYNTAWSWSFWIYPTNEINGTAIITKSSLSGNGLQIWFGNTNGRLAVDFQNSHGETLAASYNNLSLNKWNHVVVLNDGSGLNTGIGVYVNGSVVSLTNVTGIMTQSMVNTQNLMFSNYDTGTGTFCLNGFMAHVAHWTTNLNSTQVSQLYAANGVPTGLSFVGSCDHYWKLGVGDNTSTSNGIIDSIGSANGTGVNTPIISNNGPF